MLDVGCIIMTSNEKVQQLRFIREGTKMKKMARVTKMSTMLFMFVTKEPILLWICPLGLRSMKLKLVRMYNSLLAVYKSKHSRLGLTTSTLLLPSNILKQSMCMSGWKYLMNKNQML